MHTVERHGGFDDLQQALRNAINGVTRDLDRAWLPGGDDQDWQLADCAE